MPVKKECSEGRCGLRHLLKNAAGFCRNLTGSCRAFAGYCRTGWRRVRPRRRSRDVCIQLCAIQPVKKAEFIRTVDDVSVTMLVESNMNPTSDRSGQQSGRMGRCVDFRPAGLRFPGNGYREQGITGTASGGREGAAGASASCKGMLILEEMPIHMLNSIV